jgi:hypothetical protein
MTRTQYLKLIEKEIQEINKRIDYKIINGEEYSREARDHKLLLRKIRQNTPQKSIFSKFFPSVFQF